MSLLELLRCINNAQDTGTLLAPQFFIKAFTSGTVHDLQDRRCPKRHHDGFQTNLSSRRSFGVLFASRNYVYLIRTVQR